MLTWQDHDVPWCFEGRHVATSSETGETPREGDSWDRIWYEVWEIAPGAFNVFRMLGVNAACDPSLREEVGQEEIAVVSCLEAAKALAEGQIGAQW